MSELRVRPSTLDGIRGAVSHLNPAIGHLRLQDLTPRHLNDVYVALLRDGRKDGRGGLSSRTVRLIHGVMNAALQHALKLGYVEVNVAQLAQAPRRIRGRHMSVWDASQIRDFLRYVESDRLYAAWVLFATTGMRRGEVFGLHWQDVDTPARRIHVRRTLIAYGNQTAWSSPKTDAGYRTVVLSTQCAKILAAHRRRQARERTNLGLDGPSELVFTQEDGSHLHPDRGTRRFVQLAKEAGLPRIRLHDLRHSFATLALKSGAHIKVVSELLGHSSPAVTLDIYSHVAPTMTESASRAVTTQILRQHRRKKAS